MSTYLYVVILIALIWAGWDLYYFNKKLYECKVQAMKLFKRCWSHEKFLMKISEDCPEEVKNKIVEYVNGIKPL